MIIFDFVVAVQQLNLRNSSFLSTITTASRMISVESLNLNDFSGDLNGAVDALLKAESTEDSKHHAEILAATLDKAGVRYLR